MENKQRLFHITITDNETGEVLTDDVTKGLMYVFLKESEKGRKIAEERNGFGSCGVVRGNKLSFINPFEMLALLEALQNMIKENMERDPILQVLMMMTDTESVDLGEDDEEDE
jgi:hypothetical protein